LSDGWLFSTGPVLPVSQFDVKLKYLLFLPKAYGRTAKAWPLILFLHGAGECGTDLEKVKVHGPPKLVQNKNDFPFIVLAPQSPKFGWSIRALDTLLESILNTYKVDKDRVYLTGLSMGGFGTWALAAAHPQNFAALVPICGGGKQAHVKRLKDLPIWVFHGARDRVVPVARSREMVEALRAVDSNVLYTEYPDAGHDSWTRTYDNPDLYKWLLKQRRPPTRTQ
jgi:predicted peptidase